MLDNPKKIPENPRKSGRNRKKTRQYKKRILTRTEIIRMIFKEFVEFEKMRENPVESEIIRRNMKKSGQIPKEQERILKNLTDCKIIRETK